ncbi:hypothetical protein TH66_13855 [Carbonactinospora thermoautotrophica]|uniref:Uncharacterized protein n=1 Tax=Carbonactinospora thermoautotrophica TaxID=1469144 RepID=A0A132NER8_9ACTN|nr:hypothetical protein TH66_13855 [Carbonactinospora thermoautotrophica]KWX08643.1 hypothetical protein TR74_14050 [Carbonactinospora thermoautotrophica]
MLSQPGPVSLPSQRGFPFRRLFTVLSAMLFAVLRAPRGASGEWPPGGAGPGGIRCEAVWKLRLR